MGPVTPIASASSAFERTNANHAFPEQWIAGEQVLVVVNAGRQAVQESGDAIQPLGRHIGEESAGPNEAGHHPSTRQLFEQVEERLTLPEGVHEDRAGAEVQAGTSNPDQMRIDTGQLSQQHPSNLGPLRNLAATQLFHGK